MLSDNSSIEFPYNDSAQGNPDGYWWLTDNNNTTLASDAALSANTTYTVHFVIQDNGKFDTDTDADEITDPQVLIQSATPTPTSSSDGGGGSGGCIFSPDAGFGAEWLLLLAMLVLLRRIHIKN